MYTALSVMQQHAVKSRDNTYYTPPHSVTSWLLNRLLLGSRAGLSPGFEFLEMVLERNLKNSYKWYEGEIEKTWGRTAFFDTFVGALYLSAWPERDVAVIVLGSMEVELIHTNKWEAKGKKPITSPSYNTITLITALSWYTTIVEDTLSPLLFSHIVRVACAVSDWALYYPPVVCRYVYYEPPSESVCLW